jgi:hypothetical protein
MHALHQGHGWSISREFDCAATPTPWTQEGAAYALSGLCTFVISQLQPSRSPTRAAETARKVPGE